MTDFTKLTWHELFIITQMYDEHVLDSNEREIQPVCLSEFVDINYQDIIFDASQLAIEQMTHEEVLSR